MSQRGPTDEFFNSREWLDLRYRVLKESDGKCQCCGIRGTPDNPIQVDHIKPRSTHPALALAYSNVQALCKQCNLGKGARDDTDWRLRIVDETAMAAFLHLSIAERLLRQDLQHRATNGSTEEERASARTILAHIDKAAIDVVERLKKERPGAQI